MRMVFERVNTARFEARCDRCLVPSGQIGGSELEASNHLAALGWRFEMGAGGMVSICPDCGRRPPIAYARRRRR